MFVTELRVGLQLPPDKQRKKQVKEFIFTNKQNRPKRQTTNLQVQKASLSGASMSSIFIYSV